MTKENIIRIYNNIQKTGEKVDYYRFRNCNAYISETYVDIIDGETGECNTVRLIKSYDTIVAFYDYDSNCFCEIGKFSRTTSKQLTQIYNQEFRNSERVNAMHIIW